MANDDAIDMMLSDLQSARCPSQIRSPTHGGFAPYRESVALEVPEPLQLGRTSFGCSDSPLEEELRQRRTIIESAANGFASPKAKWFLGIDQPSTSSRSVSDTVWQHHSGLPGGSFQTGTPKRYGKQQNISPSVTAPISPNFTTRVKAKLLKDSSSKTQGIRSKSWEFSPDKENSPVKPSSSYVATTDRTPRSRVSDLTKPGGKLSFLLDTDQPSVSSLFSESAVESSEEITTPPTPRQRYHALSSTVSNKFSDSTSDLTLNKDHLSHHRQDPTNIISNQHHIAPRDTGLYFTETDPFITIPDKTCLNQHEHDPTVNKPPQQSFTESIDSDGVHRRDFGLNSFHTIPKEMPRKSKDHQKGSTRCIDMSLFDHDTLFDDDEEIYRLLSGDLCPEKQDEQDKYSMFKRAGLPKPPPPPDPSDHPAFRKDPFSIQSDDKSPMTVPREQGLALRDAQLDSRSAKNKAIQAEWDEMVAAKQKRIIQKCKKHHKDMEAEEYQAYRSRILQRSRIGNEELRWTLAALEEENLSVDMKPVTTIEELEDSVADASGISQGYETINVSRAVLSGKSDQPSVMSRFSHGSDLSAQHSSAGSSGKMDFCNATPRSQRSDTFGSSRRPDLAIEPALDLLHLTDSKSDKSVSTAFTDIHWTKRDSHPSSKGDLAVSPVCSFREQGVMVPETSTTNETDAMTYYGSQSDGSSITHSFKDKELDGKTLRGMWDRIKLSRKVKDEQKRASLEKDREQEKEAWVKFAVIEDEWNERARELFPDPEERRQALMKRMRIKMNAAAHIYAPSDPYPRHPDTGRGWFHKNLRCTICPDNTACPHCHQACCAFRRAILNLEQGNVKSVNAQQEAIMMLKNIESLYPSGREVPTFLKCSTCENMVCPFCCGQCPHEMCKDIQCRKCKKNPWASCDWHEGM